MTRFVFTGGHHNSALSVASELLAMGHTIYWYGHRYSSHKDTNDSAEYHEVKTKNIPFFNLIAGRLIFSPRELLLLPLGIIHALILLINHKPKAVISFGGYLGATTAISAKILRIPIYLHEQTIRAGKANRLTAIFAHKVYLTYPESLKYFPKSKSEVIGLPLRDSFKHAKPKVIFSRKKPTLLVLGGKQGAHALNKFIFTNLRSLLTHFNLIHQTGSNSLTKDYQQAQLIKSKLGSLSDSYLPYSYLLEDQLASYLKSASYYFGRSGAHICYELTLTKTKSILIPLPGSQGGEQHANAKRLVDANLGVIIAQSKLTHINFDQSIAKLSSMTPKLIKVPTNAKEIILNDLKNL